MSGAVGDELHLTLSDKHPFQRRGQQRSVGFADGGVFGLEGGNFGLQAVEGLLHDQRWHGYFDGHQLFQPERAVAASPAG